MKKYPNLLFTLSPYLFFLFFPTILKAQNLSDIEGTWCHQTKKGQICEEWKLEMDGSLSGEGYEMKGYQKKHTEDLKLMKMGGKVVYIASPQGQSPTLFNYQNGVEGVWTFSNPKHDFPTKLEYRWVQLDSIVVSVFGKSESPAFTLFYKRQNSIQTKNKSTMENKPKATGIGGIFFKCQDLNTMKDWYRDNLGLNTNEYGAMFEFRTSEDPNKKGYLQWSPFSQTSKYFEPSQKEFMINYRVQKIEQLVEDLKKAGVTICDEIETYDYGKFVHIMDPEGNKLELWEPVDEVFTETEEGRTTH